MLALEFKTQWKNGIHAKVNLEIAKKRSVETHR
jgi:hypothetical protein